VVATRKIINKLVANRSGDFTYIFFVPYGDGLLLMYVVEICFHEKN
jgi:hypothetical protein